MWRGRWSDWYGQWRGGGRLERVFRQSSVSAMAPPDGPATLGSFTGPGSVYLCEPRYVAAGLRCGKILPAEGPVWAAVAARGDARLVPCGGASLCARVFHVVATLFRSRRHRLSLERRNLDGMHQLYMIDLFHTLVNVRDAASWETVAWSGARSRLAIAVCSLFLLQIPRYRFILVFLGAYISMVSQPVRDGQQKASMRCV